ncbi:MAG: AMP-binding protein [Alphaproteobacteria bacterium]|nr:AMP-binding protein [Alphaproteobacteria bacterium]
MNIAHLLRRVALAAPDTPAIFNGAQLRATHAQWAGRAASLAQHLSDQGLQPGDRVVLFMRNHPRYLEIMFGAWWAGLVVVPVNAKLHLKELQWIIDNAQASWAFVTSDLVPDASALTGLLGVTDTEGAQADQWLTGALGPQQPAERDANDTAWLFYTSGTTGRPKGVMITHRNLRSMGMGYFVDVDPIAAGDAAVYAAPMSHGAGIYAIPHLMAGARHVVPESGGMDPTELFDLGLQIGPMSMFAAPTIVKRLVDEAQARAHSPKRCAQSFKTIVYGGAPMYAADIQRALRIMGPRFVQIYGQGETPMVGTFLSRAHLSDSGHPRYTERLASVGMAQTPVRVRVVDPDGSDLPQSEVGEVVVRGDTVMAGYWRNPEATAAAIRDGWLWTGDMGSLDADGFVTLKDRSKDLLISGGSNIYPREVEEVLLTAPGVAEVSVVGGPDPEWGEIVVAFVVHQAGHVPNAAELDAHCVQHIARFKRPKRYVWVDELPKNNYGKVLKTELRARLQAAAGSQA